MKRDKIIYWVFTGLVALGFTLSSFMYLTRNPQLLEGFKLLGFPPYFIPLLGIAKLSGAFALINPWFPKLKEWAYAGFTFVLVGAVWTHISTNTPFILPLIFLVMVVLSYYFFTRIQDKEYHPSGNISTLSINQAKGNIAID